MNIPNFPKETSRPIDFAGAISFLEATHEAKRGPWVCTKSLQIQAMIHPKDTPPWIHRTVQPEGKNTYKVGFNAAVFNPWMCILCVGICCFFDPCLIGQRIFGFQQTHRTSFSNWWLRRVSAGRRCGDDGGCQGAPHENRCWEHIAAPCPLVVVMMVVVVNCFYFHTR